MLLPTTTDPTSRPTLNHDEPKTSGHLGLIIGTLLVVLVTVSLTIRLYARKCLTRGFGLDDVFILLAYFPAAAFTIIGIVAEERFQWNRHTWDVEVRFFELGLRARLANQMLFDLTTGLTKLSILILLYRLTTASGGRSMTIAVLVSVGVVGIICFIFITVSIFQCMPLSDYWKITSGPLNCIDRDAYLIAASMVNTVTDWLVVLLPIKAALSLNLPAKRVSMVILLFGAGILASSAGIARSYFTWVLTTEPDVWNLWIVWFSSAIELNLGIICASIPAMKPFFARYLPGIFAPLIHCRSVTIDHDGEPLTHSPSLTTFIDQSSSPSSIPQRPAPPPACLNKPLPPEPKASCFDSGEHNLTPQTLQPRDRTTIFIMYREENHPRPQPRRSASISLNLH